MNVQARAARRDIKTALLSSTSTRGRLFTVNRLGASAMAPKPPTFLAVLGNKPITSKLKAVLFPSSALRPSAKAPKQGAFLALLEHEPIIAQLTAVLFPSTQPLDLDQVQLWGDPPALMPAGNALALTCKRSFESFAPAVYRSIRVRRWNPCWPVVPGMLPIARESVRYAPHLIPCSCSAG